MNIYGLAPSDAVGPGLATQLTHLARALRAESEPVEVLRQVVEAAATTVPGAEFASVTVIGSNEAFTPVFSHDLVALLDAAQYELGEGPCLQSASEMTTVRVDDLTGDPRWPRFAPRALELGVASMLSFQMFLDVGSVSALNLYARPANAFPPDAETVGIPLAALAAVAVVATRAEATMGRALDSRDVIGQAKGILMERYRINADEAFERLTMMSQHANIKLRDIAEHLAATGEEGGMSAEMGMVGRG